MRLSRARTGMRWTWPARGSTGGRDALWLLGVCCLGVRRRSPSLESSLRCCQRIRFQISSIHEHYLSISGKLDYALRPWTKVKSRIIDRIFVIIIIRSSLFRAVSILVPVMNTPRRRGPQMQKGSAVRQLSNVNVKQQSWSSSGFFARARTCLDCP